MEYAQSADAAKALAASNGITLDGRQINVEYSGDKPTMGGPASGQPGESDTIFCGNLGFRTQENTIWEFFGNEVKTVRVA